MSLIYNGNKFHLDENTSNGLARVDSLVNSGADDAQTESRPTNDATGFNYIIIQGKDPLTDSQMSELSSRGVEFKEHLSGNAWRCRFEPTDLSVIRNLDYVKTVVKFPAAHKVSPQLRHLMDSNAADCHIDIVLHGLDDTTASEVAQNVSDMTGTPSENMIIRNEDTVVRTRVSPDKLMQIASLDNVGAIQKVVPLQLYNNVARGILNVDVPGFSNDMKSSGQGKGQIITVADTGFDRGDREHPHPAFTGRVKDLIPVGRKDKTDDFNGHGTHVCGSVLGNGKSDTMGGIIQGTAPKADLIVQALMGPNPNFRPGSRQPEFLLFGTSVQGIRDLLKSSYAEGSRVHTNSWGPTWDRVSGIQTAYTDESAAIDTFVWENPDMTICFAAGNDGEERTQHGHVGGQAASKNCITIGCCNNNRPTSDPKFETFDKNGTLKGNPDDVSVFSSRGPTLEDRIKPDVIAPGSMILSTASGAKAVQSTDFGISSDKQYFFDTGTSMATPLVAGCAAVLREGLLKGNPPTTQPSAALVKAMLINGATLLKNYVRKDQGFGRVNVSESIIIPGTTTGRAFWEGKVRRREPRESVSNTITISQGLGAKAANVKTATLKATLVYNDVAGGALQINLNLIARCTVNGQAQVRHGNAEPPDKADAYDLINNVEQVVWKGLPANATVTLEVANRQLFINTADEAPFAVVWAVTPE